ncbi:MAG: DUF1553 domain-containing protein, partial [Planctomycetes bacterium]|nr:DUF1553 domain-containing protein [Planctomycetota bacterium]
DKVVALNGNEFRRSLYIQVRRSMPLSMLEPFDMPVMSPNCEVRNNSTVTSQSLLMMNNRFLVEQSDAMAARIQVEAGTDRVKQFELAWRLTFAKSPCQEESQTGIEFLERQTAALKSAPGPDGKTMDAANAESQSLSQLCHALLSSNGFLYVE